MGIPFPRHTAAEWVHIQCSDCSTEDVHAYEDIQEAHYMDHGRDAWWLKCFTCHKDTYWERFK